MVMTALLMKYRPHFRGPAALRALFQAVTKLSKNRSGAGTTVTA
jgi:hypothetical protein